jgi:hypothetical protein
VLQLDWTLVENQQRPESETGAGAETAASTGMKAGVGAGTAVTTGTLCGS